MTARPKVMNTNGPPTPLRLQVFSHPCTVSNLFFKILSEHPKIKQCLYTFTCAHNLGPEAQSLMKGPLVDEMKRAYWEITKDMNYQDCLNRLEEHIANVEAEGKIPLLKDHVSYLFDARQTQKILIRHREIPPKFIMVDRELDIPPRALNRNVKLGDGGMPFSGHLEEPFNLTILPDRLLKTLAPIFFIRHPIRQVDSWYRSSTQLFGISVNDPDFELCASYCFSRRLCEYYAALYSQGSPTLPQAEQAVPVTALDSRWPVVIDGDDLINDPESVANKFCALVGLDPEGVIYKWERSEWFGPGPLQEAFFKTLSQSEGVMKNSCPSKPNLAESSAKWRKDWGDEVAEALLKYVDDAMDDYEYLYRFKL